VSSGLNARKDDGTKESKKEEKRLKEETQHVTKDKRQKTKDKRQKQKQKQVKHKDHPKMTPVHFIISSSLGAPETPWGGSSERRLKSLIKRRRAGVDMKELEKT